MTRANRKIGLGVMGWADMLILLGIPYSSDEAIELGEKVMKFINDEGHAASQELAKNRGAFPNFKGSIYDKPGAAPIRNATVTTIAPTGTISIIANASSGVEPLFAVSYVRQVMDKNILVEVNPIFEKIAKERGFYSEELMQQIAEHGTIHDIAEIPEDVRNVFVTAHDITPEITSEMQAAFQQLHRQRRQQDRQLPQRRHHRRCGEGLPARLRARTARGSPSTATAPATAGPLHRQERREAGRRGASRG